MKNVKKNSGQMLRINFVHGHRMSILTGKSRRFCTGATIDERPGEIFSRVSQKDIKGALELCDEFARKVSMTAEEFLSKQCSERSYMIYRLSTESRAAAFEIAQFGDAFPDNTTAGDLCNENLWHEDVKEQYFRAVNCLNLSQTALTLGSPNAARDYQIIGRSVVHKLLLGRTATVLQTFMSRKLQASKKPYEWAIANHRKAATLFDQDLAPAGPRGPLEEPDSSHNAELFKKWSEERTAAAKAHVRLTVHLLSDVSRHILDRSEGKLLLNAADSILAEEIDEESELKYAKGVIRSTLRSL